MQDYVECTCTLSLFIQSYHAEENTLYDDQEEDSEENKSSNHYQNYGPHWNSKTSTIYVFNRKNVSATLHVPMHTYIAIKKVASLKRKHCCYVRVYAI